VVVARLDRAFRSTLMATNTLADLRHHGVGFVAIEQGMDTGTAKPRRRLRTTVS